MEPTSISRFSVVSHGAVTVAAAPTGTAFDVTAIMFNYLCGSVDEERDERLAPGSEDLAAKLDLEHSWSAPAKRPSPTTVTTGELEASEANRKELNSDTWSAEDAASKKKGSKRWMPRMGKKAAASAAPAPTAAPTRGTWEGRAQTMRKEFSDSQGRAPVLVGGAAAAAQAVLAASGATKAKTLLATSTCPDEINCATQWGAFFDDAPLPAFRLGGLAGMPFAGATGFGAYSHHVPDGGAMFIFYGPHVAVNADGSAVGKLKRNGQGHESSSCGACVGALGWAKANKGADPMVPGDYQMSQIKRCVQCYLPDLEKNATSPNEEMAQLTEYLYKDIRAELLAAIDAVKPDLPVFLLGGIQVNGSYGDDEYFAARHFEMRQPSGEYVDRLDLFYTAMAKEQ